MQTVDITLIENSTAGRAPRTFHSQTVEIVREPRTTDNSSDGRRTTTAATPTIICWVGGNKQDFSNITDVEIVGSDGTVLVKAPLNSHSTWPKNIDGGVRFAVLEE